MLLAFAISVVWHEVRCRACLYSGIASSSSPDRLTMTEDPLLRHEWLAVGWSSSVKTGELLPARLLGRDVVLWRDASGVHAWEDLCIHRGAKLSLGQVSDGCVVCPYHFWHYDASGKCVFIPSHPDQPPPLKARANVFHVQEKYGIVWVALDTPSHEIPSFPEGEHATFRRVLAGPYCF